MDSILTSFPRQKPYQNERELTLRYPLKRYHPLAGALLTIVLTFDVKVLISSRIDLSVHGT